MSALRLCLASHLVSEAFGFSPLPFFQSLPNQRPGHVCTKTNGLGLNVPGSISHSFSNGVFHKWSNNEPLSRLKSADGSAADTIPIPSIPKPALLIPAERYSSGEWLKSLLKLPRSFTLRRISSHLKANTLFAVLVYLAYVIWPETMKAILKGMIPAPGPHLMLSGALGLLLVFRTNTAYDRYWEGRKHWGFLYSRTRDLARLAHSVMRGKDREHFLQLVAATPPILLQHLRTGWLVGGKSPAGYNLDLETMVKELLPKEDHAALLITNNRPYLLVKMMGAILRKVYSDARGLWEQRGGAGKEPTPLDLAVLQSSLTAERQHAEMLLLGIVETIGGCERIVKTTVPSTYSRHTGRFLSLWCFTLPLIMVDAFKWRMIPIVFLTCWSLFSIEEIGHIIEDPFNMLWEGGKHDELKIDKGFPGMRKEVMERLPATDPRLLTNGGDVRTTADYDVAGFHTEYIRASAPY